jgi:hypothetical protein
MNKAMNLQNVWRNKKIGVDKGLTWRFFQLGFILLSIESIIDRTSEDRHNCDLLWFPTGGGKTEAYIGVAIFSLAYNRRAEIERLRNNSKNPDNEVTGIGVGVISRYTLRLLTIQQFRRTVDVVSACEFLRIAQNSNSFGWIPEGYKPAEKFTWGTVRFSVGLWVGNSVIPGKMCDDLLDLRSYKLKAGAISILQGLHPAYYGTNPQLKQISNKLASSEGEPAQILKCPCCGSILAIPSSGLSKGKHVIHLLLFASSIVDIDLSKVNKSKIVLNNYIWTKRNNNYYTLTLDINIKEKNVDYLSSWLYDLINLHIKKAIISCASPIRPGYFVYGNPNSNKSDNRIGYDIYCPNPSCDLNDVKWSELVPLSRRSKDNSKSPDLQDVNKAFELSESNYSKSMPIPAITVEEDIFGKCPSILISTIDKFARLPYEPKTSAIFGNVSHYHSLEGYYRPSAGKKIDNGNIKDHPDGCKGKDLHVKLHNKIKSPDIIIQDELHLIEGPLGSIVGLYEIAIDELCTDYSGKEPVYPKYIASSATVKNADVQINSLFNRSLNIFPPNGLDSDNNFFYKTIEIHPMSVNSPGRLYVGIACPGKGGQTALVRILSSILQESERQKNIDPVKADMFWTLVGYFNAIRELAGASTLYSQDIPDRIKFRSENLGKNFRKIHEKELVELSSRINSQELPSYLDDLEKSIIDDSSIDAVFATSMLSTGIDIGRFGVMVVDGQPKTTSQYIQTTGRIGRQKGGIVFSFYRVGKPRDLDHYEFFTGYHRALNKNVEPITVAPYSPLATQKIICPVIVSLLRDGRMIESTKISDSWIVEQKNVAKDISFSGSRLMKTDYNSELITILKKHIIDRSQNESSDKRPDIIEITDLLNAKIDQWKILAERYKNDLLYSEITISNKPTHPVVLGTPAHEKYKLEVVSKNSPNSMREVESEMVLKGGSL